METLGSKIRMLRKARHLTQQELGGDMISASMVSQIEANRALPSEPVLESIAKKLGVAVHFFRDEFHMHQSTQTYRRAKALIDGERYHEALDLYVNLIASPPPQVRMFTLYTEAAQCYQNIDDVENATQMYNHAAEAALEVEEVAVAVHSYYQVGTLLRKKNLLSQARMYWFRGRELLLRHPDLRMPVSMKIHNNLGQVFYRLGQYSAALQSYQYTIAEAPNFSATLDLAVAYHGLGDVRVKLRDYAKATEDTQRAMDLYESVRHLRGRNQCKINLAVILREQEKFQEALTRIDTYLTEPEFSQDTFRDAIALSERGLCLVNLNRVNEAIQDGIQATFMVQSDSQLLTSLYIRLAQIYFDAKMPIKTLETIEKAADLNLSVLPHGEQQLVYLLRLQAELQLRHFPQALDAGLEYLQVQ